MSALVDFQLKQAQNFEILANDWDDTQIQMSSVDLRLTDIYYEMSTTALPRKAGIDALIRSYGSVPAKQKEIVLRRGNIYLFLLKEKLRFDTYMSAKASPKSTTGRLDAHVRLLTENAERYDEVPQGYSGRLYLEVIPQSFDLIVRENSKLTQLRIFDKGRHILSDADIHNLSKENAPVKQDIHVDKGIVLSLDLGHSVNDYLIGYSAKPSKRPIDIDLIDYYNVDEFWDRITKDDYDFINDNTLILRPNSFYILATYEKISIAPEYAGELLEMDISLGEFRVHYAGFFDPGFGYDVDNPTEAHAKAVLEVRTYQFSHAIEHRQAIGRLKLEKVSSTPKSLYGKVSNYQKQGLRLAKQFRKDQQP